MINPSAVRRVRGDGGAVLVIALLFLLMFALMIPAVLGTTSTNLSATSVLSLQRNEVYAAEGAIFRAVETARSDTTIARYSSPSCTFAQQTINNVQTQVTCVPQPSSGINSLTRPRYGLLALPALAGPAVEGISDVPTNGNGCGGSDVYVGGDVASNGFIARTCNSSAGHFYIDGTAQARVSCDGVNIVSLAGSPICQVVSTSFVDPGNVGVPGAAGYALSSSFPGPPALAACRTNAAMFSPGYYTAMPVPPAACSSKPWWFAPGTYYFDFTSAGEHLLNLDNKTVVAGTPALDKFNPDSGSLAPQMPGSCKTEDDLPPYAGVKWIFGADTHLSVGTGKVELCPTPSFTTQEIAIQGYGAGGATSPGQETHSQGPTANSVTGSPYLPTPANAYAINEPSPTVAVAAILAGQPSTITLSAFASVPANASIERVLLRVKHMETPSSVASMAATVRYSDASTTSMPPGCGSNQLCASGTLHEDSLDITHAFEAASSTSLANTSVTFRVTAGSTPITETLDGIVLDVTYALPGNFRRQAGCAVLLATDVTSHCDTLTNAVGGQLYVIGTVYAPLGRIVITTATGDPVQFNRGVIGRDIVGAIHPGHGQASPFSIGRPARLALFRASVKRDGAWLTRVETLVRLDDNVDLTGSNGSRARANYVSWRVLR